MNASKPIPTKRMNLGIQNELAAARQVAQETNVPTLTFPSSKPAPEPSELLAGNIAVLPTAPSLPTPPAEKKVRGPKPAPVRRYSVDLPVYAIKLIHDEAYKTNRTKKRVVLEALKAGGLDIKDIDIQEPAHD